MIKYLMSLMLMLMLGSSKALANMSATASQVSTNTSNYTKNLNSTSTDQQKVDNIVDQLNAISGSPYQCPAGKYPSGIDTAGNAIGCTTASTGGVASVTASSPLASSGGTNPNITFTNPGYITLTSLSAGNGITYNNSTGVISNAAPDQTVTITPGTGINVTGTYPNFTVVNTSPSSGGTVTSLTASAPLTGGTITSSGTVGLNWQSSLFLSGNAIGVNWPDMTIGKATGVNWTSFYPTSNPFNFINQNGVNWAGLTIVNGTGVNWSSFYPTSNPKNYITGNQTITASGDATGSGTTSLPLTLATVNSNVGSFTNANITVNAKGLITAASNGSGGGGSGVNWNQIGGLQTSVNVSGFNWQSLSGINTSTINWLGDTFKNFGINWSTSVDLGKQNINWYDITIYNPTMVAPNIGAATGTSLIANGLIEANSTNGFTAVDPSNGQTSFFNTQYSYGSFGTSSNIPFNFKTNSSARMYITAAGNVEVGTDSTPPYLFCVGSTCQSYIDASGNEYVGGLLSPAGGINWTGITNIASKNVNWVDINLNRTINDGALNWTNIAPISVAHGGTGTTSLTANRVVLGNGTSGLLVMGAGTNHQVLHGNASGAPTFSAVDLTADVSNVLPLANGGRGINSGQSYYNLISGPSRTDNLSLGGLSSYIVIQQAGSGYGITGIAGGVGGEQVTFFNGSVNSYTFYNLNGYSLSYNVFKFIGGADYVLQPGYIINFIYNGSDSAWEPFAYAPQFVSSSTDGLLHSSDFNNFNSIYTNGQLKSDISGTGGIVYGDGSKGTNDVNNLYWSSANKSMGLHLSGASPLAGLEIGTPLGITPTPVSYGYSTNFNTSNVFTPPSSVGYYQDETGGGGYTAYGSAYSYNICIYQTVAAYDYGTCSSTGTFYDNNDGNAFQWDLSWSASGYGTGYIVQQQFGSNYSEYVPGGAYANSFIDSNNMSNNTNSYVDAASNYYLANGSNMNITYSIYTEQNVGGTTYFSSTPYSVSNTDPNDYSYYAIGVYWNAAPGASGYRIVRSGSASGCIDTTGTNISDPAQSFSGSCTVTPTIATLPSEQEDNCASGSGYLKCYTSSGGSGYCTSVNLSTGGCNTCTQC